MKKIYVLFLIALLGMGQVWSATLYGKVAVGSGKGEATVEIYNGYNAREDSKSTTGAQVTVSYGMSIVSWGYNKFSATAATGYAFEGWYTNSECTSGRQTANPYQTETSRNKARTDEYWAKFTPIHYSIAFNGNGAESGSTATISDVEYDKPVTLNANGFTKVAYTVSFVSEGGEIAPIAAYAVFDSWNTASNGSGTRFAETASVMNLASTAGATATLYAQWNGVKKIILPAAGENGTSLFDGWYDGETLVGYAGDSYTPSADVTLTAHWTEIATPVFGIDDEVIELGQSTRLALTNVDNPSITITPEGIVSYDATTGLLTGVGVGQATIAINQAATPTIIAKYEELTISVTKKTPSLAVKLNDVDQTSVTIYQGATGTVSFVKESDAEVVVEVISGAQCASYTDGVLTAGEIGTAVFRASLPETETYSGTAVEFSVTVESNPVHLPMDFTQALWNNPTIKVATEGNVSWNDNRVKLGDAGSDGLSYRDRWVTIHFEGIPDKLTFEYSYDYVTEATKPSAVFVGQTADPNKMYFFYVEESADNENWTALTWQDTDPFRNSWKQSGDLQLKKTTRYVRLHYNANLGAFYRNIHISEMKYVDDPVPASVDFGTKIIYSGEESATVNVNWCNIAPLSVVSTNPKFTVSPSSFANYDQYGSQTITIGYNHTAEVGDFSGEIIISNGNEAYTKTIPVHAQTTKRIQTINWNADLEATGFAMNVGEQYPDATIAQIATAQSGGQITYSSANSEIIEVVNDTILLAKAEGPVEITAYQAGDNEYAEVSDTKTFTVTLLQKQTITWEQNLFGLLTTSEPVELTAEATSGMEITYESADENVVRIEGNMLIVVGEGETTITATQAGGTDTLGGEWLAVSATNYVIVRDPASQCNEMAMPYASLELNADHLSHEFDLVGVPAGLTFTAKHGEKSTQWGTGASYATLVVEQYAFIDGVWDWYQVFNQVVGTSDADYTDLALDESATKIRFATGERATNHTITNIRVPRKKFMRSDVEMIDAEAEANAIWQQTITISHSNIDLMTVSTAQGLINLNVSTLGAGCGDFGDAALIASFTPAVRGVEYLDTIIITDGKAEPTTLRIPVRLVSTGLKQYINGFELPESCLTTESVIIPQATATSGLEVVYLSSDSTIAYVENNVLVILSAGTVDIIAYQAGDERWNEASMSKTIQIDLTPVQILKAPEATDVATNAPVGMALLRGGLATVEGTFSWLNPDQIMTEPGEAAVLFTPTQNKIYDTATIMVDVVVTPNPTTFGEYTAYFCEGDSVEFAGVWYYDATEEPEEVVLEGANIYQGDSVIMLTIIVHPIEYVEMDEETMHTNETLAVEPNVWYKLDGEDEVLLTEAAYVMNEPAVITLIQHTTTEFGCKKTIVRYITITEATDFEQVEAEESAEKFIQNGTLYIRRGDAIYTVSGLKVE